MMDDVDMSIDESSYTAHDCASVLKTVLAEFEEPVISLNYFFAFQQVAGNLFFLLILLRLIWRTN